MLTISVAHTINNHRFGWSWKEQNTNNGESEIIKCRMVAEIKNTNIYNRGNVYSTGDDLEIHQGSM